MPDPVVASISTLTRDHRGKVRNASLHLRRFENQIKNLGNVKGIRVRMPIQQGSDALNRASNVRKVLIPIMREKMGDAFDRSQVYVPVDTGTLKASGRVEGPTAKGRFSLDGAITYGEGNLVNPKSGERPQAYAIYVHERTELSHAPPTQAKFLERAVEQTMSDMDTAMLKGLLAYYETL